MASKAQINWALERAQNLWFMMTDRPPSDEFIRGIASLLRKTRKDAVTHARGRIKVLLHREDMGLTEAQKKKIFREMEKLQ